MRVSLVSLALLGLACVSTARFDAELTSGQIELQRLDGRVRVRALAGLLFAPGAA